MCMANSLAVQVSDQHDAVIFESNANGFITILQALYNQALDNTVFSDAKKNALSFLNEKYAKVKNMGNYNNNFLTKTVEKGLDDLYYFALIEGDYSKKLEAIKAYKDNHNCSLKEAKEAIDTLIPYTTESSKGGCMLALLLLASSIGSLVMCLIMVIV